LTVFACLCAATAISFAVRLPSETDFDALGWELRHVPTKWVQLVGGFLGHEYSGAEADERVAQYLILTARISQLERVGPSASEELDSLRDQRSRVEPEVEWIVEGRLTSVLEETRLESSFPFFPSMRWVFPPVDVELERPPPALAVSRRDRIELLAQRPLQPSLSLGEAVLLEEAAEQDDNRSAIVESTSGVATYPSIVAPHADYRGLMETVAHEWVHQYLAFKPLGLRYLSSYELRTLNETVADIVAAELAERLVDRYPLPRQATADLAALEPAEAAVDVDGILRSLRVEVDALLAGGKIGEAEALMERRRLELVEQGITFRRINQAFFAFRSLYGTDPDVVSPVGEKLQRLRAASDSVGDFLTDAAQLTGVDDLDARLGSR
jgi:hypothetical protein